MTIVWGIIVTALASLAWVGQVTTWLAPPTAERLGLTEPEQAVEPAFHADVRGEAVWDTFSLWTLVAAGVLLLVGSPAWPYFGLGGGAMYVYFAGRGIATRVVLSRRGLRIGTAANVRVAFAFLTVWLVVAAVTVGASVVELRG